MKILMSVVIAVLLSNAAATVHAADGTFMKEQQTTENQDKDKDKNKDKDTDDPNKGGAGVGPPTVHGCDSKGCGNNGPSTPKQPEKKCRKEKGIEICN